MRRWFRLETFVELEKLIKMVNENDEKNSTIKDEYILRLIDKIIEFIYKDSSYDSLEYVETQINNMDDYAYIERTVKQKTELFIKTIELRKLPSEILLKYLKIIFDYKYNQFEDENYACEKENINSELVLAVECYFAYCESSMVLRKISQRRAKNLFCNKGRFSEEVFDLTWSLFKSNNLDNQILLKNLADIQSRINGLLYTQNDIKSELLFIEYLILKKDDKQE